MSHPKWFRRTALTALALMLPLIAPLAARAEYVLVWYGEGYHYIYIPDSQLPHGALSANKTSIQVGESVIFNVSGNDPLGYNLNGLSLELSTGGYFYLGYTSHSYAGLGAPNDGKLSFTWRQNHSTTHTITFTKAGTYTFVAAACDGRYGWLGSGRSAPVTITVAAAGVNNATYVSQSGIPTTMLPRQQALVNITMSNAGTQPWNNLAPQPYSLGSQNAQDNMTWGLGRVSVGATAVAPAQNKTFTFTITAPATPGAYNFQWKMVQDGKEWFGALTPNVVITVKDLTVPGTNGVPIGMTQDSNGNGIPDLMEINLGLDPTKNNSAEPALQNLIRTYQYDKNDRMTGSPERAYNLDAEGNIKSN